jgi:hypothetical protein
VTDLPDTGRGRALQGAFWRHDLLVALVGALLLGGGLVGQWFASCPALKAYDRDGVKFQYPASWLQTPTGELRGEDAITRITVASQPRPENAMIGVDATLELQRGREYGRLYQRTASERQKIGDKEWLRTAYTYAFVPSEGAAPRIASAIELAYPADLEVNAPRLTIVTLHGTEERLHTLEPEVVKSLAVSP